MSRSRSYAQLLRRPLRALGFDLVRTATRHRSPPPVTSVLSDVVLSGSTNHLLAFTAPVEVLTWDNGFSLHPEGWNPYRETAVALLQDPRHEYDQSALKRYYHCFQPLSAAEYLCPELADVNNLLSETPADAYVTPWSTLSPEQARTRRHAQNRSEERQWNSRISNADRLSADDGTNRMGPVTDRKGRIEFARLSQLTRSISKHGYRRERGVDIKVTALMHQDTVRLVIRGGYHRAAVVAATGESTVAVILSPCCLIDTDLLCHGPAARSGLWDRKSIVCYLDYLFSQTGRERAQLLGIL